MFSLTCGRAHLSHKLRGEFWRITGCMFIEESERLNHRLQSLLDSIGQDEIGEESRQDGDQGQACCLRRRVRGIEVNL